MGEILIRSAVRDDLPRLTEIYNHYVLHTPMTFDVEPYTVESRKRWFQQFAEKGRHRLLVAEEQGVIVGYTGTTRFRPKPAYDTTVETTIYCAPEALGRGIGRRLYEALFQALKGEDIHRFIAVYALPNPGTEALHSGFGFKLVGVFTQSGRRFGKYWDVAWMERAS
jgi:phosphinothricin acetyltransferase